MHVFAMSKMTCQIGSAREKRSLAVSIAKFALESFRTVFIVFVSFQIGTAGTLVRTHVTRENLLAQVDVRKMLVPDTGGSEPFIAGGALVGAVSTMTPGVSLYTTGELVWGLPRESNRTADPAAKDLTLNTMG